MAPTDSPPRSAAHVAAVGIAALAFFVFVAWSTPMPGAFRKYSAAAQALLDGSLAPERLLDFSPLYLGLSVFLERLVPAPEGVLAGLQVGLAAFAVAGFFVLLRRSFGLALALAGTAVLAFDRHLLVYQRILEPEVLLLAMLVGLLLAIEGRGTAAAAIAGVLAAACVATRPTFLPIFLLLPLYFRLRDQDAGAGSTTTPPPPTASWRRRSAVFLVPLLLGLLVVAQHARRAGGSLRAPVMNPGTVFYEGNQPLSRGTSAVYPPLVLAMVRHGGEEPDSAHQHYREVVRAFSPGAPPAEVNRLWAERGRNYLLDHPATGVERVAGKLRYALHVFRWHDVPLAWRYDRRLAWPSPPFSVASVLALVGLWAMARRWREALPFYVLLGTQMAVMLTFYVSPRQRLVMLPAVLFFAAAGFDTLRRSRRRLLLAVPLVALAVPLTVPDEAMRDEVYRRRGFAETEPLLAGLRHDGTLLARQRPAVVAAMATAPWWSDWMRPAWVPQQDRTLDELVAEELRRRLDEAPAFSYDSARFDLADALLRAGDPEAAVDVLEPLVDGGFQAYRGGRQTSDPEILLAEAEARLGHTSRAVERLRGVLEESPGDPFALALTAALDPRQEPGAVLLLDRYVGEADRRWLLGRALRHHGRAEDAVSQLQPLADGLPMLREVHLALALALGDAGQVDQAVASILEANRLGVEPVLDVRSMASIARRWAERHPDNPEVQLLAARLLHQHGHFDDAAGVLEKLRRRGDVPAEIAARALDLERRLEER